MKLQFDLANVDITEFGLGRDNGKGQTFVAISCDNDVQAALQEMARTTWTQMQHHSTSPERYDPSEKHTGIEHLYLPINDDLATVARELHEAENLPIDANALKDPALVYCYFAKMVDSGGKRLTALRRATQFKGTLKSRLIRFHTNALKIVKEPIFRLDQDFDLLVDSAHVHILRPASFEFAGKLQEAIMDAVPNNIEQIRKFAPFIDFSTIEAYAAKHPRAARYVASIRSLEQCKDIDKRRLRKLCDATNVEYTDKGGKLIVKDAHIMGLLEVLDRRRYEVELIEGTPERFKAASRQKLAS